MTVSVSALSDHLMGLATYKIVPSRRRCFSIRSFGSFDGTFVVGGWVVPTVLFQYPLFRII